MELVRQIEALLFVTDEPVSSVELAQFLEVAEQEVVDAVWALEESCRERAIQVVRIAGGYQLSTKPHYAELIGRFLKPSRNKLTRSQMEVLAVVAYQQPVTMAEVDHVRGVHSDHAMRTLLDRRLVHELGRKQAPGRPILYGTSEQFLHLFNLESLEALPPVTHRAVESDDSTA